jgi:sec-independent protein translocase protein TatA
VIGPHVFGMGIGELLVVLVVVLVVFGPGRLPEVMGSLGKGMQEFKKGLREPPEIEKMPENDASAAKARREG